MDQDGKTPFRFTGKELDAETGFYYYGARYLNPKTSVWISADPAVSDYIPQAPVDDEAKKHNENLPGMGGVYNYINFHVYHYAGNNPVKYIDPDGEWLHIAVGALVGGVISAGVSMASEYLSTGEINAANTIVAFGAGAVSGALAATGVGLAGQIIGNGLINGVANTAEQLTENGGDFASLNPGEIAINIGIGLVSGKLGGPGANSNHHLSSLADQLTKRVGNAFEHKSGTELANEIVKAVGYYIKNSKTTHKDLVKSVIRSNIPAAMVGGEKILDKMIKDIEKEFEE
jgi:hypothetical protein